MAGRLVSADIADIFLNYYIDNDDDGDEYDNDNNNNSNNNTYLLGILG